MSRLSRSRGKDASDSDFVLVRLNPNPSTLIVLVRVIVDARESLRMTSTFKKKEVVSEGVIPDKTAQSGDVVGCVSRLRLALQLAI